MLVRQAHPGPDAQPYRTFAEKMEDARRYEREEKLPWSLLVDDLEGTVHQTYGGLADPTYLIDRDGRVAFYNLWTYAPTLHQAIMALLEQDGRGVVLGGVNRAPHMLPALTKGFRGLKRGLPQSYVDLELASPGAATASLAGYLMSPLLSPLTQRARPLPTGVKVGLAAGAVGLVALGLHAWKRRGDAGETND